MKQQYDYTQREWDRLVGIGCPPARLTRIQKFKKLIRRIINKIGGPDKSPPQQ
jgi:hypothetical protein